MFQNGGQAKQNKWRKNLDFDSRSFPSQKGIDESVFKYVLKYVFAKYVYKYVHVLQSTCTYLYLTYPYLT